MAAAVPFVITGPEEAGRIMSVCEAIQSKVPAQALHFSRDPDFWALLPWQDHDEPGGNTRNHGIIEPIDAVEIG
jgi:hypothetical protein